MATQKQQDLLEELRTVLPDTPQAQAVFARLQEELAPDHLFTTREAADFLGIRSVNTLKALLRTANIPTVKVGTHTRVARRELDRLRQDRRTRALQEADARWDEIDAAFGTEGLTQAEMDGLSESRPGTLPWQRD
jgi:excisionase family DNA binding protein